MTLGETRVRVQFNPSADSVVDQIKQKTAELIDLCETLKGNKDPRLVALAQTSYEEAAAVNDIIERLRNVGCDHEPFTPNHARCVCRVAHKAADELVALRARVESRDAEIAQLRRELTTLIEATS